ncbi:MAG TPA: CHASE3 domain-containing protein [Tepidisphaeraceae bacterium]|nr:CHASE3 domain-containing protein [Tepidisphaeraceae bacterium]
MVMLCVIGIGAHRSTNRLIADNHLDIAAQTEMLELSELVSSIKDAETGQRGFLLTGDEGYLEPYGEAITQLDRHVRSLRQSASDTSTQRERLATIEPLLQRKLAELRRTITLRRANDVAGSLNVVRTGEGKALMDQIRSIAATMRDEDGRVVQQRDLDQSAMGRRTLRTIWFGTVFTFAVVLMAGLLIRRDMLARRRAERALRDAEQRYRLLIESVQDYAVLMLDPGGQVVSWNAGAQRIKGYRAEEIVGRHFSQFYRKQDVERGKPENDLRVALEKGRCEEEGWRVRKDGSMFWASVILSSIRDESGQLRGFAKITRDITERKRSEDAIGKLNQSLQQHTAQLEVANKELEAFCYSVSHDLRAPLRSIDGFSQALLEDYGKTLEGEGRDFLQRVRAGTQRMAQLIDDLLNLSRVTRGELSRSNVDLSAMARLVAAELQKANPGRAAEFVIADGLMAEGDARLLRVVLDNLLGNAWKFTAKQESGRIEFGSTGSNGSRRFFVRDNGAGFDMTYGHKLFGAFQRLHANDEFAGTGVGLATVQRIIHRHGGKVSAEGEVGKGAMFQFTL